MEWLDDFMKYLETAVAHYERSAPTVSGFLDGLYIRINEKPDAVRLSEIAAARRLLGPDGWAHPNYAANAIYHLMHRLGQDTTGQAGF